MLGKSIVTAPLQQKPEYLLVRIRTDRLDQRRELNTSRSLVLINRTKEGSRAPATLRSDNQCARRVPYMHDTLAKGELYI